MAAPHSPAAAPPFTPISWLQGYISLSFPQVLGHMSPAEAVIGYIHPETGPFVSGGVGGGV